MIIEYSRRRFLLAGASTALALPLMESLGTREARAQTEKIQRFIVMNSPNGVSEKWFKPTGEGTGVDLGAVLTEPFAPIRDDLLLLALDCQGATDSSGDPHGLGMGCMLNGARIQEGEEFVHPVTKEASGWGGKTTVDQLIAQANAGKTQFDSLNFAVENHPATLWTRMSFSAPGEPVTPEASPQAAFDRIFGAFLADPVELQRTRARRASILDGVRGEITQLSPTLSSADRLRLEEHATIIRELEGTIATLGSNRPNQCVFPERPTLALGSEVARQPGEPHRDIEKPENDREVPLRHEAFRQLMVRALACDLTRVTTLLTAPGNSYMVLSWTGVDIPHHGLSHMGDDDQKAAKIAVDKWYASQFAELVKLLKTTMDPNGQSILANSAALYVSEIGDNNRHNYDKKSHVIAGQAGGAFRTGQFVRHPDGTKANSLFVSLCHAMGHPQINQVGDADYGSGPLTGVS